MLTKKMSGRGITAFLWIKMILIQKRSNFRNIIYNLLNYRLRLQKSGADPEILKRRGALCRPPWLADEENFTF